MRLTPYHELNDPLECRFLVNPIERERAAAEADDFLAEWAEVEVFLRGHFGQLGILCFSRSPEVMPMWTHYASCHTGLVVGFDSEHPWFQSSVDYIEPTYRGTQEITDPGFGSLREVVYSGDRISIEWGDPLPLDAFFQKGLGWAYEEEVRTFRRLREGREVLTDKGETICLIGLPPKVVRTVILGANCSVEERVKKLTVDERFAHVNFERAVIQRRKYGLRFEAYRRQMAPNQGPQADG